jgi:hypothetical protein
MRGTPKSSIEIGISTVKHQFYEDLPLMETLHNLAGKQVGNICRKTLIFSDKNHGFPVDLP